MFFSRIYGGQKIIIIIKKKKDGDVPYTNPEPGGPNLFPGLAARCPERALTTISRMIPHPIRLASHNRSHRSPWTMCSVWMTGRGRKGGRLENKKNLRGDGYFGDGMVLNVS